MGHTSQEWARIPHKSGREHPRRRAWFKRFALVEWPHRARVSPQEEAEEAEAEEAEDEEAAEEEAEEAEEKGGGGGAGEGKAPAEEAPEDVNPCRRMVCAPDGRSRDVEFISYIYTV